MVASVFSTSKDVYQNVRAQQDPSIRIKDVKSLLHGTDKPVSGDLAIIVIDLKAAYRQWAVRSVTASAYTTYNPHLQRWEFSQSERCMFGNRSSVHFFSILDHYITAVLSFLGVMCCAYIDDTTCIIPAEAAPAALNLVRSVLTSLGLEIAEEKTGIIRTDSPSDAKITVLGFEISAVQDRRGNNTFKFSLPDAKVETLRQLTDEVELQIRTSALSRTTLQRFAGHVIHATTLARNGPVQRIASTLIPWGDPAFFSKAIYCNFHKRTLRDAVDTLRSLITSSPPTLTLSDHVFTRKPLHIFSDASLANKTAGVGAFIFDEDTNEWRYWAARAQLHNLTQNDAKELDIAFWEAHTVLSTICNPDLRSIAAERHVFIHCDNTSTLYSLSKFVVKSTPMRMVVRHFVRESVSRRFEPVSIYVKSKFNIADALTRDPAFAAAAVSRLNAKHFAPCNVLLSKVTQSSKTGSVRYKSIVCEIEASRNVCQRHPPSAFEQATNDNGQPPATCSRG
jgi:hypothetical protein